MNASTNNASSNNDSATMADAVNAQRQADEAAAQTNWYATTPAKAVGVVAIVAVVAAVGYYGWKTYSGGSTVTAE